MDKMKLIKKLEKMLKTMQPNKVVAALTDKERLELSQMITNVQLNSVVQNAIER